jgi:alpha-tubulin suppressor-like RCC1 family protein
MRALLVAACLCAACVDVPPFACDEDAQCGDNGRCEDDGACSFTDDTCHTGRRYGEHGGQNVANVCVGDVSGAIASVSAGSDHTCAGAEDGRVWCWGDNQLGGLGRTDVLIATAPEPVPGVDGAIDVDGGEYHTCAVAGGQVFCWGRDQEGELGDGATVNRPTPQPVANLVDIVQVDLGEQHSCARDKAGAVWCWGRNNDNEGGGPGPPLLVEPRQVNIPAASTVIAGGQSGCAIAGADVWCWGKNENGQLGVGDTNRVNMPERVPGYHGARQIVLGGEHSCALMPDGTVRCAGQNSRGQLGDNSTEQRESPVEVIGLADVAELTALDWATCARTGDGTVYCWGANDVGQLGDEGGADRPVITAPVPLPRAARAITGGENHACAQTDDGCVWCWGSDAKGQLGAGRDDGLGVRPVMLSCW